MRAVMVLVDNSPSSINQDFEPNRLGAQTTCVERLAQNFRDLNSNSQVGVITLSPPEFGIRSSLTSNPTFLNNSIRNIRTGKQPIDILHGVKIAILALKNCNELSSEKKILLFVSSDGPMNDEIARNIDTLASQNNVLVDIVVLGDDVHNIDILKKITANKPNSYFLHQEFCPPLVADYVLASGIGIKKEEYPYMNSKQGRAPAEFSNAAAAARFKENPPWYTCDIQTMIDVKVRKPGQNKSTQTKDQKKGRRNPKMKDS